MKGNKENSEEFIDSKALVNFIDTLTVFPQIQEKILKSSVVVLSSKILSKDENFWSIFCNKVPDLENRAKVIENVLSKITIEEMKDEKVPEFKFNYLNLLKAKTLLVKSQNILDIISSKEVLHNYLVEAKKGVGVAESAYMLYQLLSNLNKDYTILKEYLEESKIVLNKIVEFDSSLETQFGLFKLALECRQKNLPDNKEYWIDLLVKLGSYGMKIKDEKIKVEALKFSQDAYNIINEKPITTESAVNLIKALEYMQNLFVEFGDLGKAKFLSNQLESIKQKYQNSEKIEPSNNQQQTEVSFIHIIKQGPFDQNILDVKKQIQKNVLDKIQEASACGKWMNMQYGMIEYGVAGYVEITYLKKQLGDLNDEKGENYKLALKLCFEAINIGIMNSVVKNPICAVIFCKNYSDIIQGIINKHPEYFVDGYILKTALKNASEYSKALIGQELKENNNYNYYFEEAIIPVIAVHNHTINLIGVGNVTKDILTPLEQSLINGESLENTKVLLKTTLSDEYIFKIVGNNLTRIDDVYSIVRLMAFKVMAKTIAEKNLTNFSCITIFNETYPELALRINKDHPEYYADNKHTKELCNSFVKLEQEKLEKLIEQKILEERLKEEQKQLLEKRKLEEQKQQEEEKKKLEEQKKSEEGNQNTGSKDPNKEGEVSLGGELKEEAVVEDN
jgi:hypothetical protein